MGSGWNMAAFWVATAYSIYTVVAPTEIQSRLLLVVHVDPSYRLAVWGFGLAAFFLYAGFRAWNGEYQLAEHGRLELEVAKQDADASAAKFERPGFHSEITEVAINGDSDRPEWIHLHVYLVIRNQGADSAVDRWMLRVVPPQPATPFILTEQNLSVWADIGRRAQGGNRLHDPEIIKRGGRKEGWLHFFGPQARYGFTTGQSIAVEVSFKDVHGNKYSVVNLPNWDMEPFFSR